MANPPNPYAVEQQFTEAINPQQYVSTAQTPPQSGTKGQNVAGSIATIADKFLAGVSRGRAVAFQRQQQDRAGLMADVNRGYETIEKADLTDQAKAEARGKLNALHLLAVKQSVDDSKDKSNPMVKGLKHIFEGVIGPGAKKYEFGPEQIYKTLNDVNKIAGDPANTKAGIIEQAGKGMTEALTPQLQKIAENKKQNPNAPGLTQEDLLNNKQWMEAANKFRLAGGDLKNDPTWVAATEESKNLAAQAAKKAGSKPTTYDKKRQESIDEYIERNQDKFPNAKKDEEGHYDPSQLTAIQRGEATAQSAAKSLKKGTTWIQRTDPATGKDVGEPELVKYDTTGSIPGVFDKEGKPVDPKSYHDAPKPTERRLYGMMQQFTAYYEGLKDEDGKSIFSRKEAEEAAGADLVKLAKQSNDVRVQQAAIRGVNTGVWSKDEGEIGNQPPPKPEAKAQPKVDTATPPRDAKPTSPPKPEAKPKPGGPPNTTPPGSSVSNRDRQFLEMYVKNGGTDAMGKQGLALLASGKIKDQDGNPITTGTVEARKERRKAAESAYGKLTALADSTRAFDNALGRHATILENNRAALPSTDIPKINKLLLSGAENFNLDGLSPAAAKYVLSLQAVRNEYARIIGGGVQSTGQTAEGARIDAGKALSEGFSTGSMKAALGQMNQEVKQKTAGIQDELKREKEIYQQPIIPEIYGKKYKDEEAGEEAPVLTNTKTPPDKNLKERTDIPREITAKIAEGQSGTLTGPDGKQVKVKKQGGKIYQVNQ